MVIDPGGSLFHHFHGLLGPLTSRWRLRAQATLLGHESLDTTAIYSLPSEEDLAAEVERSSYNIDA